MIDKVYVLTELVSDYNQHGEYFLGAFKEIPTIEQINTCDSCFGYIDGEQYQSLIEDGYLQYHPYYDFLYVRVVEL